MTSLITDLTDRVAVVTGAGSGIGAATALSLAQHGAHVLLLDMDRDALESVSSRIVADGGQAAARVGNVRTQKDCSDSMADAIERFGGVDIIVNSAGVVRYGRIDDLSESDWDVQIDTNLKGIFRMLRAGIPVLRARGGGSIVNVASTQAFAAQEQVPAYAASKGAIVAMTRALAIDHARDNIRVNAVGPGSVDTPMLQYAAEQFSADDPQAAKREWGERHPIGRVITAAEVANIVVFLAGDAASAVTGATYLVDGGATARLST